MEKRSAREDGAYQADGVTSSLVGPRYGAIHVDLGLLQAFPVLGHSFFCTSCTNNRPWIFYLCPDLRNSCKESIYLNIYDSILLFSFERGHCIKNRSVSWTQYIETAVETINP